MTKCAMITGFDAPKNEVTTCQEEGTLKKGVNLYCETHVHWRAKEWRRDEHKDGSFKYVRITSITFQDLVKCCEILSKNDVRERMPLNPYEWCMKNDINIDDLDKLHIQEYKDYLNNT